jgi:hypothetical protein
VPPRSPQPPALPRGNEDAFLALSTIGPWVNNADTKIGLLATALTVLTCGAVRQRPRVEALVDGGVHLRGGLALAALVVCVIAVVVAGACLYRALRPRLTTDDPSRFAFPHLATADLGTLADMDPATVRKEAWIQAQTLAQIVNAKYECFRSALRAGLVAGVAFVAWLVLVPA